MKKQDRLFFFLFILALLLLTALLIVYVTILRQREDREQPSRQATIPAPQSVWLSYGDSITDHGLWQPIVLEQLAFRHIDAGISGSRVSGSWPHAFWNEERLEAVRAADPDFITIMGGTNDFYSDVPLGGEEQFTLALEEKDLSSYLGAYSYLIENLLAWKSDLKLILITPPPNISKYVSDKQNLLGLTIDHYADACRRLADHYHLPLVDLYTIAYDRDTLMADYPDGVHPNPQGAAKIAELVVEAFRAQGVQP